MNLQPGEAITITIQRQNATHDGRQSRTVDGIVGQEHSG